MQAYVYILECVDGSFYTGSTKNIEQRLYQHQTGMGANHTKKHLPVKLVFVEEFSRIDEAFAREKQIQGWSRKKKQALIDGDWERLKQFAACQNETAFDATALDYAAFDSAQATDVSLPERSRRQRSQKPSPERSRRDSE
jgi:putative endonuclease